MFLNIPLTVVKKLPLAECFDRNKIVHFCLFNYCRVKSYLWFANQLLEGTVVLM